MKWPDLRHLDGYLPPDMERAYRLHYLKDDTRTAGITMSLLIILLVAFAYNDYLLFGLTPPFYFLIALRSAFLIYFILLTAYLHKNRSPQNYDLNLLIWLVLSMVMVSVINLTRPASYSGNFMIDVILVLLVYLCMPMRLAFRMAGALIFTAFEIFIFFVLRWMHSPVLAFSTIISLVAANAGGIFASGLLYSFRRSEYQARIEREKLAEQWQTTFDSITDLISIQDSEYRVLRANKAYLDTFKIKAGDLPGKHCYEIVHKTTYQAENCPHRQTLQSKKPITVEMFEPHLGIFMEVSTSPIFNSNGDVTGTVHMAKDITERKLMQKKLEELWTHDFLTGLPNRVMLEDRFSVAAALAKRKGEKIAIMTLDLDRFKLINDSLGHAAGDQVLKAVAGRLSQAIRANDTVSRVGGDEFQVLMQDARQRESVVKVAERIVQSFIEPIRMEGQQVHTSTSIGIAIFPDDGEDLESLSKKSDEAMYQSKGKGRNCYTFYAPNP
jgi:diguanylate cyclase (GGDEF)-like protein/PAS domain S-box-containing protein